jgi:hypothetical protein
VGRWNRALGRIDTAPRHHSPRLDEQTEEEHRIEREERVIGAIQAAILAALGEVAARP